MGRTFNGANPDQIKNTSVVNPASITMSAWVYPTSAPGSYGFIAGSNSGSGGGAQSFSIFLKSSRQLAIYYNENGASYDPGTITLSLNTWSHLVFLGPGGANATGYVNGTLDSTGNQAYVNINTPPTACTIGYEGSFAFTGIIADVAMWSVALTTAEITALAKGARPNTVRPASLVRWWPLDGLSSPEPDLSGNAQNGTLTGTSLGAGPPVMPFTPRWPQFLEVSGAPPPPVVTSGWATVDW